MKYSIGYRPAGAHAPCAADIAARYDGVEEVYYPWVELPSGRSPLPAGRREQLEADLAELHTRGVQLNLLLNASCWGAQGFTRTLGRELAAVIEHLATLGLVDSVTAFSPMVAGMIKRDFATIEVRASVNLRIGTVEAMEQVADLFDGFTVARECNRNLSRLAELGEWCRREGKKMQLLANSGCLPHCPVQTFHDNLVSHEGLDARGADGDRFANHIPGGCWEFFSDRANRFRLLAGTWIRPEDVHHYEAITPRLKLATRMHSRPGMVVRAYARQRFGGNLLDLLEPSHAGLLAPCVIDNTRFGADWFQRVTAGASHEAMKEYYLAVLRDVLVDTAAAH